MGDVIKMDKTGALEAAIRIGTKNLDELLELKHAVQTAMRLLEAERYGAAKKILKEAIDEMR